MKRKEEIQESREDRRFHLDQVAIRMVEMPPLLSETPIESPESAIEVMADMLKDYDREVVAIVNLRPDGKPINMNVVSMGALDQSIAHPREILKSTILANAASIVLVHNHPSGKLIPSTDDIILTNRLKQISDLIGIRFLDHIIVGPGKEYYSFHQKDKIPVSSLKLSRDLDDIKLEGLKVSENTKEMERKRTAELTVAECSEFHSMGEEHVGIKTAKEAIEIFNHIPPERMNAVPAIGVRLTDEAEPDVFMEVDIFNGKRFELEVLSLVPEIRNDWNAQRLIAELIHAFPEAEIRGEIPEGVQKKIQFIESREKQADQLKAVTDQLEKGVAEVFQSDKYKQFLDTMAKFPRYSVNNSILIMMQKPDARLCQSYTGWKEMGRYVKKGEKGINILAPAPYKVEREQTKFDEKGKPVLDADGEPVKEKVEVTVRAFKIVKTFDIAQTDGKEIPSIGPNELIGSIEGYPKLLQALQEISPVPVTFEQIDSGAKGFYHQAEKRIAVQDGMSEVQTIKTLLHEMAHQKLHDRDTSAAGDIPRNGKEVEAESVAYVVCQHYGINTSDYSFSYVAGWSEGKETPELKSSLDKIRQTAAEFISQIDERMEVLLAEKEQTQEAVKESGFTLAETKEKPSVKSRIKEKTEKAEKTPRKNKTEKMKEERA